MKLSKKGFNKIYDNVIEEQYDPMFLNFESNDFQDCVILTVKEAKEILQSSYDVLSWSMVGPTHRDNAVYVQNLLKYRIEQAEAVK